MNHSTDHKTLRLLQNIIDHAPVRLFWKDRSGRYLGANKLFLADAQMTADHLLGKTDFDLPWSKQKQQEYFDEDKKLIEQGGKLLAREDHDLNSEGELRVWLTSKVALRDDEGCVIGMLGSYEDITTFRMMETQLEKQTALLTHQRYHDSLTQLANRVLLQDRMQHAIEKCRLHQQHFSVYFIDLDMFKKINDSLGHELGDRVICEISRRLSLLIRGEDTLARLGGDEFVILYESFDQLHEISLLAQKINEVIARPIKLAEHEFYLSASIGISLYPENGNTVDNLLRCADAAMFRAKDLGRNQFQFYTEDLTHKAVEHIAVQAGLRQALKRNEFEVYYQPQVDAYYDTIIGVEALVRWLHPQQGLLSPNHFIPIAEEAGIMWEIDRWVIDHATMQFKQWLDAGLNPGKLSLNLSVKQLQQADFIEWLQICLDKNACKPEWLEFELTETELMTNFELMISRLLTLEEMGISLAIDDFGTGYSSLAYLKRLPIKKIKIDKSFINDLPLDEDDAVITRTIIAMADQLGLKVLAEGVETPAQRAFLLKEQCSTIQGYLYSQPVDSERLVELLIKGF
ncbi:diguanylate cyclase [Thiomicrospira aerophila AL3]|uniref:Diguanylate cyclase n=1 Tax=Thiomicrospira aerophila AL3 TaxID=717772 RepID=W0DSS3_9GAMM|nr:GGDEF and EAL domain-containing protein [Thiomicrospira aerophila]AHF01497.1 diguanylate cyclase [Thiomicrospira aerophila AL3]